MIQELLQPFDLLTAKPGVYRIVPGHAKFLNAWGDLVNSINRQHRLNVGNISAEWATLDFRMKPPELTILKPLESVGFLSDNVHYWLLFVQMDSVAEGAQFEYLCNRSVAARLRTAFSNAGIKTSVTLSGDGHKFLKGKRATKRDEITDLMKSAIYSGQVYVECTDKYRNTMRSRVSSLQCLFQPYTFSVVSGGDGGVFIRAKAEGIDRVKALRNWYKELARRVENCEEITDVHNQCDLLREILMLSPGNTETPGGSWEGADELV